MASTVSSINELRKLIELCRELGVSKLKTKDGIELELSENLQYSPVRAIMTQENLVEEPLPEGIDPQKAADLKRLREQQRLLKTLFNDNN
jgi:hypothetical protein